MKRILNNKSAFVTLTVSFMVFSIVLCAILSGCSIMKIGWKSDIAKHLQEKYHEDFTFIRNGDASMYSGYDLWRYANSNGEEFYVRIDQKSGAISDNYQSVLYDQKFADYINNLLDNKCIVSVSTKNNYFGDVIFDNCTTYINSCKGTTINVYTQNIALDDSSLSKLSGFSTNNYSIWNAVLDNSSFEKYKNSTNPVIDSGITATYMYKVSDGKINKV